MPGVVTTSGNTRGEEDPQNHSVSLRVVAAGASEHTARRRPRPKRASEAGPDVPLGPGQSHFLCEDRSGWPAMPTSL